MGKFLFTMNIIVKKRRTCELFNEKNRTRLYSPNFENVKYLNFKTKNFVNSKLFEKNTLYLPSGPGLKKSEVIRVAKIINKFLCKKNTF